VAVFLGAAALQAQDKGTPVEEPRRGDSVMIFRSPRPLVGADILAAQKKSAIGIDVLFSGSGFGFGTFYSYRVGDDLSLFGQLAFSGARNSDEFEYLEVTSDGFLISAVPDKVNRLFMIPVHFGGQLRLFRESLSESLQPFIAAGVGSTFILSTPYRTNRDVNGDVVEFFRSFGQLVTYVRPSLMVGIGAQIGNTEKSTTSVSVRYYYTPFGGDGLESVRGLPMHNFGGLFISLAVGYRL
jgi:hypothetical protein